MQVDVRIPIGLMFTLYGLLLAGYGLITSSNTEMYRHSLGLNINLWWGVALLAFGVVMLLFGFRGRKPQA